ncbi:MAG: putative mandelate racemase/muconate lactonizing enzyme family protein, partial [Hyphomicrobiales bacterium]|nr:putative mandelate racemase/muconate lactonizing enzyme family protein [Hyphomicrobiales bacterium]
MDTPLSSALVLPVDVTPRTRWIFIQLSDADGTSGFGEATYGKNSIAVVEIANKLAASLVGSTPAKALAALPKPKTIVESAAISGLDQALHDLAARSQGMSIATLIGGERRHKIGLYANINRRTRDRTPAGFANSAQVAIDAGYTAFKIAPFDEVTPEGCAEAGFNAALDRGLARIAAVR